MSKKFMRKNKACLSTLLALGFTLLSVGTGKLIYYSAKSDELTSQIVSYSIDDESKVYPSGAPIGIYVKTKGVMVIGVGSIEDECGKVVCPCEELVEKGDYIHKVDGIDVKNKVDFIDKINSSKKNEICLDIYRNGTSYKINVNKIKAKDGSYKLGLWVKDDIAGIGTLTFVDKKGFAALGHSINDNETGEMFEISEGAIYNAKLINIVKPSPHMPGRLEGIIDYSNYNMIGKVKTNEHCGISGGVTGKYQGNIENLDEKDFLPIGKREDVNLGRAYIVSSLTGERKQYEVSIEKINHDNKCKEKNIEIKVCDPELLSITGGIVQGMSGSPIIQDGKLIGAVTHVFVDDPTRGYGIFIDEMLKD